ncbi:helix-turn-helix domain-containing protein [Corynebacteriaceae bacterium 6-324]
MTAPSTEDQLEELFAESFLLNAEWRKINVTPSGRLRLRLKPEQEARSEEIRKQSNKISKQISQLTNQAYDALSAPGMTRSSRDRGDGTRGLRKGIDMNNQAAPALLKVAEFVELTGVSKKAVNSMILRKEIKARKLNPSKRNSPYLIPRSELTRFLDEVAA